MLGLEDLERYLRDRYVTNVDVVGDLLTPLLLRRHSPSRTESISLITDTINRMSLLRARGLWEKLSDLHLNQIIRKCLSPQDQDEFFRDEAKYISDTQMGVQVEDCNMEFYLQTETLRNNLKLRISSLMNFLRLRQAMYSDREASARVLGASPPSLASVWMN